MKQQSFERLYSKDWDNFEAMLLALESRTWRWWQKPERDSEMPALYRRLCHHLSLANERCYSSYLIDRLNRLVLRGHQQLYRRRTRFLHAFGRFFAYDFPVTLRKYAAYFWVAALLFYGPGLVVFALCLTQPELVFSVFSPSQIASFEYMYDPAAEHVGRDRDAGSDMQMFGHYIQNNISIGFQTFASGILLGLGSIFFLLFNGIVFGAITAHLVNIHYEQTFFTFVIGHASLELTAIVIAGAAGLMLGHRVINPGQMSRGQALRECARETMVLVYGIIVMLLLAAFVEAFWSSNSSLAAEVKYSVGGILWLLVFLYFLLAGRSDGFKPDQR